MAAQVRAVALEVGRLARRTAGWAVVRFAVGMAAVGRGVVLDGVGAAPVDEVADLVAVGPDDFAVTAGDTEPGVGALVVGAAC